MCNSHVFHQNPLHCLILTWLIIQLQYAKEKKKRKPHHNFVSHEKEYKKRSKLIYNIAYTEQRSKGLVYVWPSKQEEDDLDDLVKSYH